jgi:hypothetical protein
MQNKANSQGPKSTLTAAYKKSYDNEPALCPCENKANLASCACGVPVGAPVETQDFASLPRHYERTGLCKTKPISL